MTTDSTPLPPAILVYHESARSIVFRDHLRRQHKAIEKQKLISRQGSNASTTSSNSMYTGGDGELDSSYHSTGGAFSRSSSAASDLEGSGGVVANFTPQIVPLPKKEYTQRDVFQPLLEPCTKENCSSLELRASNLIDSEMAVVKTLKHADWTHFLHRLNKPFRTSCSLLPAGGYKMRCYGQSNDEYTTGVIFPLPSFLTSKEEDEQAENTKTWCWPSGYAARTEYNIDSRGNLINGRNEARISFSELRQLNVSYLHHDEFLVCGRMLKKDAIKTLPYNEVFIKVGATSEQKQLSFQEGLGLPIALFVRSATYGHLISTLRTRSRISTILKQSIDSIPILFIHPDYGTRIFTKSLQTQFWKEVATHVNPFQNPNLGYKTKIDRSEPMAMQQKMEELFDLEQDDTIRSKLTPEECARIAGGFGATDESVAKLLMHVVHDTSHHDNQQEQPADAAGDDNQGDDSQPQPNNQGNQPQQPAHDDNDDNEDNQAQPSPPPMQRLQAIVNEGLTSAVRAGDYHTSRQLLILYSLVATKTTKSSNYNAIAAGYESDGSTDSASKSNIMLLKDKPKDSPTHTVKASFESLMRDRLTHLQPATPTTTASKTPVLLEAPPPPPLDTDRLRSATNSDGLLSVLGAAEVLKAIQDGSARTRVREAISAIQEWIEIADQNLPFRLASWHDQRVAQGDLEIAMEHDSSIGAFLGSKAITNRKAFAQQLQDSFENIQSVAFLHAIDNILKKMHSPCLRLELLQYILGLDNRYSVAHVARSVELAATCLSIGMLAEHGPNAEEDTGR